MNLQTRGSSLTETVLKLPETGWKMREGRRKRVLFAKNPKTIQKLPLTASVIDAGRFACLSSG